MKKLLIAFIFGILLISLASAGLGGVTQGDCKDIKVISNCTRVVLTQVENNKETFILNQNMTHVGGQTFNYSFCNTSYLGEYQYTWDDTCIDCSSEGSCGNNFIVTPSGNYGTANIVFFVFVILMLYAITFIGFFGKNIPITVLGGMSMLGLGLYTINNGIIIYRDWITNYFSYVTLAIGGILSLWAILEWIIDEFG